MKFLSIIIALVVSALVLDGCTKPAPGSSLTPIQSVGCAVETDAVGAAAGAVASTLSCSDQAAITASLMVALGNVNMCAVPVPAPASATMKSASVAPSWSKIGDVSAGDLSNAKSPVGKVEAKPMGIIGSIACPIVVNTVLGFATSAIPAAWGCSASAGASSVASALSAACILAVPL